jgi:leader peptidase (prepilin peptidase) / N-methyltransferase
VNTSVHETYQISANEVIIVSVLGGIVGIATWGLVGPLYAIFSTYLVLAMLLIAVIDSRVMLIPDALSLPSVPVGLAAAAALSGRNYGEIAMDNGLAIIIAGGSLYAIRWVYQYGRGVEGLGLGDVKLGAAAGAWLGLEQLSTALFVATFGAVAAIILKAIWSSKKPSLQGAVPLGSFIAIAVVMIWFDLLRLEYAAESWG